MCRNKRTGGGITAEGDMGTEMGIRREETQGEKRKGLREPGMGALAQE